MDVPSRTLTLAIIARNAAAELPRTIGAAREAADEVVVLDTGSTDDTPGVAAGCGAKVERYRWADDFSAARNTCLAHCTGGWVLWLDAGEELSPSGPQEIREFVASQAIATAAYRLPIALGNSERVYQVRLHPRLPQLAFSGRVRETLYPALEAAGIAVASLHISVERPDSADPLASAARAQRNIRLADRAISESGSSPAMHNCLAEALQTLGDPLRAAHQYRRALQLSAAGTATKLEAYYGLLTCLDHSGPDRSRQLSLALEALEEFPLDAQLLVALSGYLLALGQRALAARAADLAFRHGQVEATIPHVMDIHEVAAACAAALHRARGDRAAAQTLLEAAVRTHPRSLPLARQLVEMFIEQEQLAEARAALASFPAEIQQELAGHFDFLGAPQRRLDPPQGLRIVTPHEPAPQSTASRG